MRFFLYLLFTLCLSAQAKAETLEFSREEHGHHQTLTIMKNAKGLLTATIRAAGPCSRVEKGTLRLHLDGNSEIELDGHGEGRPIDEYILNSRKLCQISIRLAAPERDLAWVREAGCSTTCPFYTLALERK